MIIGQSHCLAFSSSSILLGVVPIFLDADRSGFKPGAPQAPKIYVKCAEISPVVSP